MHISIELALLFREAYVLPEQKYILIQQRIDGAEREREQRFVYL